MAHRNVHSIVAVCLVCIVSLANANWLDTFENSPSDLTWDWQSVEPVSYGQSTTFTATRVEGAGGNHYVALTESKSVAEKGAAFGVGFVSEIFADVRMGAVVNVDGDATTNYQGFGARASYFPYPGAGGVIANAYVMHVNWENGPTDLRIDVEKVVQIQNTMSVGGDYNVVIPGYLNGHSYYAQLDILGGNPTYVTGALYEYKGGPLVGRIRTLVDTAGKDYWEDASNEPAVLAPFPAGVSGVFAQNEHIDPAGFKVTFDNVSSVSDGPAAVALTPADGAADVTLTPTLTWVEASFATDHVLWLGPEGNMQPIHLDPAARSYAPATLRAGTTYQWRLDEIGPSGTVEGFVSTFTTIPYILVEDFESYANDRALRLAWDPNLPGQTGTDPNGLNYIDTDQYFDGAKSMRITSNNVAAPYYHQMTRSFASQDWTAGDMAALALAFRGTTDNAAQALGVQLVDAAGHAAEQMLPAYAIQADGWHEWYVELAPFAEGGVDLSAVAKIGVRIGNGVPAGHIDTVHVDAIRLYQPKCYNPGGLDLRGDANGDCTVNLEDLAITAAGWLNSGMAATP